MAAGFRGPAVGLRDDSTVLVFDRFERAWRSGVPDLADYVDCADPSSATILRELAIIDLEHRLERDASTRVEDYLRRFSTLAADDVFIQEAARLEFRVRRNREPQLSFAEYRSRFPSISRSMAEPDTQATIAPAASLGSEPSLIGVDVGGIRIVRLIAEGGMGRVYEGRQDRPRRDVAVKVMRPGIASSHLLKRFEYEAHVLGGLRHPGIGQIFTVGTHERDGERVPYFVMELIPGARGITAHAAAAGLPVRARLELFRQVCDAVAHGHQRGVIHRDLKPANILVDDAGNPKVIDFGVARCTGSDVALTTMQTDVGQLVGTLQYMSPEQFEANPDNIDVRCDVYSLGVVLFELLAGRLPYDLRGKSLVEMARVVRDVDPPSLSTVDRGLPRDLAAIAAKCLEKDRGRRYSSASELAADIGRHLAGDAVVARPPGFVDSVARIARRHKAATAAVAAVAAALVFAVAGVSFFAVRAQREKEIAIGERNKATEQESVARKERDRARGILAFLLDTFTAADPNELTDRSTSGQELKVVDVLAPAVEKAQQEFGDDPATKAEVLHTLGKVLSSLGSYEAATPAILDSHAIFAEAATRSPEDEARYAASLGMVAGIHKSKKEFGESARLFEQALAIRERVLGPDHADTVKSIMDIGGMYLDQKGSLDLAKPYFRRALETSERALGPDHPLTLSAMNNLATIHYLETRYGDAEAMYGKVLERQERAFGPDHPSVASTLNNLAMLHQHLRRFTKAEPLLRRSLSIREKVLGEAHPETAQALSNLALNHSRQGHIEQAEPLYRRALAIQEKAKGAHHIDTALALENLASLYLTAERLDEAQPLFERVIAIREKDSRPHFRENLADCLMALATVHGRQKQFLRADPILARALRILEEEHGIQHPKTLSTLTMLGKNKDALGRVDEAEAILRKALEAATQAFGPDDPRTLFTLEGVAAMTARQGKHDEAARLLEKVIAGVERGLGPRHPNTLRLRKLLEEAKARAAATTPKDEAAADENNKETEDDLTYTPAGG